MHVAMDACPPQNAKASRGRRIAQCSIKLHRMKTRSSFPRLRASRNTAPHTTQPLPPAACGIAISPEAPLRGRCVVYLAGPLSGAWVIFPIAP